MTAKDITKLQQDLREAQAMGDTAKSTEISNQILRAGDVMKALKGGYTQQEAEQFATREATIRDTDQKRRVSEAEAAFESQSKARVYQNINYLQKQLKNEIDPFAAANIQRQIIDNQNILSGMASGKSVSEAAELAASATGKINDFRQSADSQTYAAALPHLLQGKSIEEAKTLAEKEIQSQRQGQYDAQAAAEKQKREREILENQERNKYQMERPHRLTQSVVSTYRDAGPVQGRDPDPIGTAIKNDPLNKQGFVFGNQDERRAYMGSPDKQPGSGKSIYQRLTPQEYGALNLAAQAGDAAAKNELDKRFQQGQRYIMDSGSAQALKSESANPAVQRSNTGMPLTKAEEAKRDAEAKQQEDMKTRDMQFRLQQEAHAREGKPAYIPAGQPVPGKPGSVADGRGGWRYPSGISEAEKNAQSQAQWAANKAAINARTRAATPSRGIYQSVPKQNGAPFNIRQITNRMPGQNNTGFVAIGPDGKEQPMSQDDWKTPQGKSLLKNLKINSEDNGLGRIVTTRSGRSKKTTATPSSPGLIFRKIDGQVRAFSPESSASSNSPAKTGMR